MSGHDVGVHSAVSDHARFTPADADALVAAALACQWCLGRPSVVVVDENDDVDEDGGTATCECVGCGAVTRVGLERDQLLRLVLAPPAGVPVFFG